jgi:hypothetical protein
MAICTSAFVAVALGFAGWHPAPTAYEATVQSYQGGQIVQRDIAPQRVQPLTEGSSSRGAGPLRLADGDGSGDQSGVDTTYLRH